MSERQTDKTEQTDVEKLRGAVSDLSRTDLYGIENVILENIPDELKRRDQWVAWKAVPMPGKKARKIPINPATGDQAKANDSATWGSFEAAVERARKDNLAGIGYEFAADDPYAGIDLDHCRDNKTGQWVVDVADWTVELFSTYAEASPSGTGVKLIVRTDGKKPERAKRDIAAPGLPDETVETEVYDRGRYFTFTGHTVGNNSSIPAETERKFRRFADLYFSVSRRRRDHTPVIPSRPFDAGGKENMICRLRRALRHIPNTSESDWFRVGCSLKSASTEIGEESRKLFHWWSRQADLSDKDNKETHPKYEEGACDDLFDRLDCERRGVGSIFYEADLNGWNPREGETDSGLIVTTTVERPSGEAYAAPCEPYVPEGQQPWEGVTDATLASAVAGTPLQPLVDYFRSPTVPPLPMSIALPKAFAVAGALMAAPIDTWTQGDDDDQFPDRDKGITLAKIKLRTVASSPITTNCYFLIAAPSGRGKDIGDGLFHLLEGRGLYLGNTAGSPEGFYDALTRRGNGVLTISEFKSIMVPDPGGYGSKNLEALKQCWNKGVIRQNLSHRGGKGDRFVDYAYPTVVAHIQPEVFRRCARQDSRDDGFYRRFMMSICEDKVVRRPRVGSEEEPLVPRAARIALDNYASCPSCDVRLEQGYLQDLLDEFHGVRQGVNEDIYNSLVNEMGPKLAVILQCGGRSIRNDTWERAKWILRWFFEASEKMLQGVSDDERTALEDERSRRILSNIRKRTGEGKGTTARDVKRNILQGVETERIRGILRELENLGVVRREDDAYYSIPEAERVVRPREFIFEPMEAVGDRPFEEPASSSETVATVSAVAETPVETPAATGEATTGTGFDSPPDEDSWSFGGPMVEPDPSIFKTPPKVSS